MSKVIFTVDGEPYNVRVKKLSRSFSVMDSDKTGRAQSGAMYRDPIGTYYNYTMVVDTRGNDVDALDAFWEVMSTPDKSHRCVFPYNQETLTQDMYVTSGSQELKLMDKNGNHWGELSINFIAMKPKKVP